MQKTWQKLGHLWVVLGVIGAVGGSIGLYGQDGQETTTEATEPVAEAADAGSLPEAPESLTENLAVKYQVITDRNPFNLQPPPPPAPPKTEEEPEKEPVSLKELNITLAGVSARSGDKRVWLSMTLPPTQPEAKPVERFFAFREGEQQHGVSVKSISPNGNVDIVYDGTPVLLSFETHGNKKAKPKPKAKSNVRTARTTSSSSRGVTGRTGNRAPTGGTSSRTSTPRSGGNRVTGNTNSRAVGNTRSIPARPVRTAPPQQALSRNEQITSAQAQQIIAEKEGTFLPPLPPVSVR